MFSKPVSLILVYVITIFNIAILASPILAAVIPFVSFTDQKIIIQNSLYEKLQLGFCFLIFLVSFLMMIYLVLDFLFGFSLRASLKACVPYQKVKDYDFLTELFDQAKNKFGEKNVKLYIKNSDEVNAYAVASLGRKIVVLTRGLIDKYLHECSDSKNFLYALRSIIGHEMSHLVNKDFLPTFLIITNQKITNFVSRILNLIFNFFATALSFTPYGGRVAARVMLQIYSLLNFAITAFNRFVVYNIYEFLRRFLSRSIEYRCDRQSAKAFGGKNMSFALSMLGESGYFTLFSTHPRTKTRMKRVENIKITEAIIKPNFFDSLSNYFSLMFLVVACLYFAKQAHIDLVVRAYLKDHELINRKLLALWHLISKFF